MQQPAYNTYRARRSIREENTNRITPEEQQRIRKSANSFAATLRRNWRFLAVAAIAIVVLFLNLRVSPNPTIIKSGTWPVAALHSDQDYHTFVRSLLQKPINSNKLTIEAKEIESATKQKFPELESVAITLPILGTTPAVHLQPYEPKLMLITDAGRLYALDATGRVIAADNDARTLAEKLKLQTVNDRGSSTFTVGDKALPASAVAVIDEFVAQLTVKQLAVTSTEIASGTNSVLFRIDGESYFIRASLAEQGREQAGAYLAARDSLRADGKSPSEYVDVRVVSKVYYK